jgi:hypothetical protein
MANTSIKNLPWGRRCMRQWFSTCAQRKLDAEFVSEGRKMTREGGDLSIAEVGRWMVGYNQQDFYIIFYVMLM